MVFKNKFRSAPVAKKGATPRALPEKKKHTQALKAKPAKPTAGGRGGHAHDADEGSSDALGNGPDHADSDGDTDEAVDLEAIDDSDTSDSEVELEEKITRPPRQTNKSTPQRKPVANDEKHGAGDYPVDAESGDEDGEDEDEDEDDEDIPVSDLEDLDDEDGDDLIPHTRLIINNTAAILTSLGRIALPTDPSVPFATHQSVTAAGAPTADSIPDASDDLKRELAFYAQGLDAANVARSRLLAEGVPFSRPGDYFAEMVKEDAHMEKVRARLVEEAASKKAAADARRLRDLKKFGKQVQVAKLQERHKAKKDALDKIKQLKRKRQENPDGVGTHEADMFDVAVDDEIERHEKRRKTSSGSKAAAADRTPNAKRQRKNEKYGYGGKKRHAKSGDAVSSSDLSGFSVKKMKGADGGPAGRPGKASRPGKNRRKTLATKRG